MAEIEPKWETIDTWWNSYIHEQQKDLSDLRNVLSELDSQWEQSDCLFDRDPLAQDWKDLNSGPLRAQEENWSQWLAHLMRSSSGEVTGELFGEPFATQPEKVDRENVYQDDTLHDRRVDIIVEWANRGVSIEVKIDDEEYEKTPQTAFLTEKHHRRDIDWTHFLLLPERKSEALSESFPSRIESTDGERPIITPVRRDEVAVTIMYWHEVSQTLRQILLEDAEYEPHETASAYLLTTLIEEKILQFFASSSVSENLESVAVSNIDRLQSIDPKEQISYFDGVLKSNHE